MEHDSAKTSTAIRETRRVTLVGMGVNFVLSGIKFTLGYLGGSQAVIADAVHSLSDMATDVAILLGLKYWSAPADDNHPYGHRRIETMITVFIGTALGLVGVGLGYHAIATMRDPYHGTPTSVAMVGSLLSIFSKEGLYRWTVAVGRRIKSPSLIANAWHHRSDALSSIPAVAAVAVAVMAPRWAFVDHVGAIIIALFIIKVSWDIIAPALVELADGGVSTQKRLEIRSLAESVDGVRQVHALRTRKLGSGTHVDLHLLVDGDKTIREGHEIAAIVKHALLTRGPDVIDVLIHVEPNDERFRAV